MPGLPATLMRHRARLDEIASVFAKYGFAAWVQRGSGLVSHASCRGSSTATSTRRSFRCPTASGCGGR